MITVLAAPTGDIAAAEDALADAFERALTTWPRDGVPDNPEGWLLTVAVVLVFTSTFQVAALPFVEDWPWPLRLLLSAAYVVTALRLLMPRVSRLFGSWLQGSRRR